VRTRIALTTAAAVIVIPVILFALFIGSLSASAQVHHATDTQRGAQGHRRAVPIDMKLTSYSQTNKEARLASYYKAVAQQQEATYLKEFAFLKDVAFFSAVAAANSVNAIPSEWLPTAMCEEGGRDDPRAGYFGILAWDGFDGYPAAGSAPLSVQLAWEAAHGQGPPDAPGQCHGY
jgi:hypothetical protein